MKRNTLTYALHEVYKKIFVHWHTTIVSAIIFASLYMWWRGKIDTDDMLAVWGGLAAFAALFSKDPNKIPTKAKFQKKDPE